MGGQSIPLLDFYLAPYVAKSFIRNFCKYLEIACGIDYDLLKTCVIKPIDKWIFNHKDRTQARIINVSGKKQIVEYVEQCESIRVEIDYPDSIEAAWDYAKQQTDRDTFQAMESLIHNLCSLASRAGSQVPFSSVNIGMDISEEGRLITKNLFYAQEAGLGNGETAIFPISIFQMKKGINDKGSPNYDLFQLACRVSSKRLFPNFNNEDASFNIKYYKEGHPETEVAVMGMVDNGTVTLKINQLLVLKDHYTVLETNEYTTIISIDISNLGDFLLEHYLGHCTTAILPDGKSDQYTKLIQVDGEVYIKDHFKGYMDNNPWTRLKYWMRDVDPDLEWYKVTFADGITHVFSHDHPLIIERDHRWSRVHVKDIKVGDVVFSTNDTRSLSITKIELLGKGNRCGYDVNTESDHFTLDEIASHNCVYGGTRIVIKDPYGKIHFTTADYFRHYGEGVTYLKGWQILSTGGKFVDLINVSIRHHKGPINTIGAAHGSICVTDEHIVPILRDNNYMEVAAKDIQLMDCLISETLGDVLPRDQELTEINLIDLIGPTRAFLLQVPDKFFHELEKLGYDFSYLENVDIRRFRNQVSLQLYHQVRLHMCTCIPETEYLLYTLSSKTGIAVKYVLDNDFGRFLGLLYSEGNISLDRVVITNSNEKINEFVKMMFSRLVPHLPLTVHTNKNGTDIIGVNSKVLSALFKFPQYFGYHCGSGDLRLPEWIYEANTDFLKGFLGGVIDGDGSVVSQNYTRIITASESFAKSLQYIISILGYRSSISIDRLKDTVAKFGNVTSVRNFDNYRVTIDNRDMMSLNLQSCLKSANLDNFVPKTTRVSEMQRNLWNRVRYLNRVEFDGFVYDFETGDNYFVGGTTRVHNCRTRVISNIHNPNNEITPGRGNIFVITINLPYIALRAKRRIDRDEDDRPIIEIFYQLLDEVMDQTFDCEMDRFEMISKKKALNYPFLMGQHIYMDSDKLLPNDEIREVIKNGTITTGFIGLAETLIVLTGKHHGESEESQKLGLEIVKYMYDRCVAKSKETHLNFSFMGSPAEGCCGRLLKLTRKEFGVIPGVTDKEYLTNSHHRL